MQLCFCVIGCWAPVIGAFDSQSEIMQIIIVKVERRYLSCMLITMVYRKLKVFSLSLFYM